MKRQFATFLIRLILNSVGIWVAVRLLGNETPGATSVWTFMMAGLIFSVVNSVLKPIVTILALPAILLTLGLFTLIVNGFMVYISLALFCTWRTHVLDFLVKQKRIWKVIGAS